MPAANAGITYLRLYLTNIDMRAMSVLRLEIGTNGVAPLTYAGAVYSQPLVSFSAILRQIPACLPNPLHRVCLPQGFWKRNARSQKHRLQPSESHPAPKYFSAQSAHHHNCGCRGNHGHRIRTVALYLLRQIGKQYIWHTPRNDRCAADN